MKDIVILANSSPLVIERLDGIVRPYFTTSIVKNAPIYPSSSDSFEDVACQRALTASRDHSDYAVATYGDKVEVSDGSQWRRAIAIARNGDLLFTTEVSSDKAKGDQDDPKLEDQSWQRTKEMFDWFAQGA